jgi:hypothetical protein
MQQMKIAVITLTSKNNPKRRFIVISLKPSPILLMLRCDLSFPNNSVKNQVPYVEYFIKIGLGYIVAFCDWNASGGLAKNGQGFRMRLIIGP